MNSLLLFELSMYYLYHCLPFFTLYNNSQRVTVNILLTAMYVIGIILYTMLVILVMAVI